MHIENVEKKINNISKTVSILLSTYNGEKYLEEQLQSIFSQTYWANCTLFVRDDGSNDGTVEILKKYELQGKLILTCGENIGFVKSFFWLIKNAPDSDYYAFADQDDIWFSNKIERAVNCLNCQSQLIPLLYCCGYSIIDGTGLCIEKVHKSHLADINLFTALTLNQATGFTIVFNKSIRLLSYRIQAEKGQFHDYWLYCIALAFGKVIYDEFSCANYRRHSKNESELKKGIDLLKYRIKKYVFKTTRNTSVSMLNQFVNIYSDILNIHQKDMINLFLRYDFFCNIKKAFYPQRFRYSLFDDFVIRFFILFGKF